jgi:hypothetical protein
MHLTEQQTKVELITEIDSLYSEKTNRHLSEQEFDFLYDKPVSELIGFIEFYRNKDEILRELAAIAKEIMNHMSKGE